MCVVSISSFRLSKGVGINCQGLSAEPLQGCAKSPLEDLTVVLINHYVISFVSCGGNTSPIQLSSEMLWSGTFRFITSGYSAELEVK